MLAACVVAGWSLLGLADVSAATGVPDSIRPADLVGVWSVTMTVSYSTSGDVQVGDIKAEQWNVSFESGLLKVKVVGGSGTTDTYQGSVRQNGSVSLTFEDRTHSVGVDVRGSGKELVGRRVVAASGMKTTGGHFGVVAVLYDIKLSR